MQCSLQQKTLGRVGSLVKKLYSYSILTFNPFNLKTDLYTKALMLLFCLSEIVPPSIKGGNITTEVSVLLNNLINLECETKGIPVPTITWYKDGHPIISSPQALYVDRGQVLQIPRAQVSDSAKYTCRVTSIAGAAEKIFDVDVYSK